ncbi:VIT family protein [Microbacterium oleivorans]|uniref:VIT1/CCC1 transporter family protein n=1 Tax=Microbacterium TaxID=33882 RepID=UPI0033DA5965
MSTTIPREPGHREPQGAGLGQRLNWLRAGVLGANDGIVSVAAVAVGVAGATSDLGPILTASSAALVGGAISMALGEYVSVSSQRDTERALIEKETRELAEMPDEELRELAELYEAKGLSAETARKVAEELTAHDALRAHLDIELGIDPDELTSPWQAAVSSAIAFTLGALLPFLAILLPPAEWRVPTTFVAVLIALGLTGTISATLGGAGKRRAVVRLVVGGALALAVTWALGLLLGTSVA